MEGTLAVSAMDPGPGLPIVLYLNEPREKRWGILLKMTPAGLWMRGIELDAFEDWAREIASGKEQALGLSTFFVPFLRVDKVVADEPCGAAPSFRRRLESITGRSMESVVEASSSRDEGGKG